MQDCKSISLLNFIYFIDDLNTNEPPKTIPLNLQKDPERLEKYKEEQEQKLKENGKKFKEKVKEVNSNKKENSNVEEEEKVSPAYDHVSSIQFLLGLSLSATP